MVLGSQCPQRTFSRLGRGKGNRSHVYTQKIQVQQPCHDLLAHLIGMGSAVDPQPLELTEPSSTSLTLPGGSLPKDTNFPWMPPALIQVNLGGVERHMTPAHPEVSQCVLALPPLPDLPSQLSVLFTSSPDPDAEAPPCGGCLTNPHIFIKSNTYDKLTVYHSQWLQFSN